MTYTHSDYINKQLINNGINDEYQHVIHVIAKSASIFRKFDVLIALMNSIDDLKSHLKEGKSFYLYMDVAGDCRIKTVFEDPENMFVIEIFPMSTEILFFWAKF